MDVIIKTQSKDEIGDLAEAITHLLVFIETKGSVASLKLTCDLIEPEVHPTKTRKKFLYLFYLHSLKVSVTLFSSTGRPSILFVLPGRMWHSMGKYNGPVERIYPSNHDKERVS